MNIFTPNVTIDLQKTDKEEVVFLLNATFEGSNAPTPPLSLKFNRAAAFATTRSISKFLLSNNPKLSTQHVDHYFALLDDDVVWLANLIFTEKQIHIQSPLISNLQINTEGSVGLTTAEKQLDHATLVWELTQTSEDFWHKTHFTTVRDASGCFEVDSVKHVKDQTIISFEKAVKTFKLQENSAPHRLAMYLHLSDENLTQLATQQTKLRIGSSVFCNNLIPIGPALLEEIGNVANADKELIQSLTANLKHCYHLFDLRTPEIPKGWGLHLNININQNGSLSEKSQTITFADIDAPRSIDRTYCFQEDYYVPSNLSLSTRFYIAPYMNDFKNFESPNLIIFTKVGQPIFNSKINED